MNKKFSQSEGMNNILPDFLNQIKKDSDMPELSFSAEKELWRRIVKENKAKERRFIKFVIWGGSIAASICILIVAGWQLLSSHHPQPEVVSYLSVMQSFKTVDEETTENVHLVLSNNQKIPIEGQEAQLDYDEEGRVNINKKEQIKAQEGVKDERVYNQLVVPVGKRSMLTFNDGTKVWINSGSKLVYPVTFEKHKREIFVEGEIFLDVTPDPERPFFVHTGAIGVKVLGTQFNVSAYADHSDCQVVLVSGEVEICREGHSKEILKPNQLYSCNEENNYCTISTVDALDYIAWKDGYYPFYSHDLGSILLKLSDYYNVQFKLDEKLKGLNCSGKLDLKDDIQDVIKALEKTAPIEILKISEREYTINVKP
jgi:hypothetical protein